MERIKVIISKKVSEGIADSILSYHGDKDQLVYDYLSGKSRGYFNTQIPHIVMNMDSKEFAGIVWGLVDVEVVETIDEKKERWSIVVNELLDSLLDNERRMAKLLKEALRDFDIL